MNRLLLVVVALLLCSCTKAAQVTGIQVGGAVCVGIAIASSHPEDVPICATAEEWLLAQQAIYGAKTLAPGAAPQAELDRLYAEIVRRRGAK